MSHHLRIFALGLGLTLVIAATAYTQPIAVEGQPLGANAVRLLKALEDLGHPLPAEQVKAIEAAAKKQDAGKLQELLDPHVLVFVHLNPEARVKAKRGNAPAILQQAGYTPILIKVHNESTVTKPLRIGSPQALPIASGGRTKINLPKLTDDDIKNRFLDVEMFTSPPMTDKLSGLKVEYALALIHSTQAGKREATLILDLGAGTADLGSRAEVPVLFNIKPAIPVKLVVRDVDGTHTTGRFTFKDKMGRVYPPKAKRLAPDFFFQDQVYRHSGSVVLLPPGELTMTYGRGPEYRLREHRITVPEKGNTTVTVKLERWIDPMKYGFYSGDHHIHAAGCSHYTNPTEGVFAEDMFLHVKGEGLNVGCNLTWGPCFEFQRQFFEPEAHKISEPFTVLKYDIEVSGFGSQSLGHVCLLNLRDQTYPGSKGTKTEGWPTWTTPLMRWAKNQGAYTGYAHSANGLGVNPKNAAKRLMEALDANKDKKVSVEEAKAGLLPDTFESIDTNGDGFLSMDELNFAVARVSGQIKGVAAQLPNLAIPEMDGIGAQEICVTAAQGLCDFISAMDTNRVPEWNCWYHIMNCGFPLKVSGETDFPCITDSRVGQGRVYVQMGKLDKIEFKEWAKGLATGRSYVSDGYAHALQFSVNETLPGDRVKLSKAGNVAVKAKVIFASETPLGTSQGGQIPKGNTRLVELIVNGRVVATREVNADDKEHDLEFKVGIEKSSWIALRQFPQMHTNPVEVIVDGAPIRASRQSALWCVDVIEQLWKVRGPGIADAERDDADRVFKWAVMRYQKIAEEAIADAPLAAIWKDNPAELARLLESSLKDKDTRAAKSFIDVVGTLEKPAREHADIVKALNNALNVPAEDVRVAAFAVIFKNDPALTKSPELVKRVLTDKGTAAPLMFLNALAELKPPYPHSVKELSVGMEHSSVQVRMYTVRMLLEYGKDFDNNAEAVDQAVRVLVSVLKDPKQNRLGAISMAPLFRGRAKKLLPALEGLTKDEDANIRFATVFAIYQIDNDRVPAVAASPLQYFPPNTPALTQVRLKAIVETEFVKTKFLADLRREAKAWSILEPLGVDAIRDVATITFYGEKFEMLDAKKFAGLMILQGEFPKAPLFKMVDVTAKGRTVYGMCVSRQLILLSDRAEVIDFALRRGVTGPAKLSAQLQAAIKRINPQAAVWSVASTKENGLEGSAFSWTLGKVGIMQTDLYVADDKMVDAQKIGMTKFADTYTAGLAARAADAKIDAKGIKSAVATEGSIVRVRFELPQPVVEMLAGDLLKKD